MATRTDPLEAAVTELLDVHGTTLLSSDLDAALRSAVKAVLPGRQQKKNVDALVDTARKAFVRTLRRRASA
jgi:hypothetical protein